MKRGRLSAILCLTLVAILLVAIGQAVPAIASTQTTVYQLPRVPSAQSRSDLEAQLLAMLNRERSRSGLSPLGVSTHLRQAARQHGLEMFAYGYLSHTARNGSTPMDRVLSAGARARLFGENLAYAPDAATAHRLLMASPRHRDNILSKAYRRVGIGVLDGGDNGVIVVQNFTD